MIRFKSFFSRFNYIFVPVSLLIVHSVAHAESAQKLSCGTDRIEIPAGFRATVANPNWSECFGPQHMVLDTTEARSKTIEAALKPLSPKDRSKVFAKEIFKVYCESGHQKAKADERIRIILPKTPNGTPVDVAAVMRAKTKNAAEERLVDVFRFSIVPIAQSYYSERLSRSGSLEFYGIPKVDPKTLEARLSETTICSRDSVNNIGIFVLNGKVVIGSAVDVVQLQFKSKAGFTSSWFEPEHFEKASTQACNKRALNSVNLAHLERPQVLTPYDGGVSLQEATYADLEALSSAFALVIPEEQQRSLFGGKSWGYLSSDEDTSGTLSIKDTLANQSQIWSAYLKKFLIIKVAQTDNPDIADATIDLDLETFCSHAIAVEDLLSKSKPNPTNKLSH